MKKESISTNEYIWKAENLQELNIAAQEILQHFTCNKIFLLFGDLGAGKTALVKAFCRQLGIEKNITSPTFSIVHTYQGENMVYHFDLYRLNNPEELIEIGFEEYFDFGAYIFIEWPEIAFPLIPKPFVKISLTVVEEFARKITCQVQKNG